MAPHILTATLDGGKWPVSLSSSGSSSLRKQLPVCNEQEDGGWADNRARASGSEKRKIFVFVRN